MDMSVAPASHEDLPTPAIKDRVRPGATLSSLWTCRCTLSADSHEPGHPPPTTSLFLSVPGGSRRFGQAQDVRHPATPKSFLRACLLVNREQGVEVEEGVIFNMEMYTNVLLVTANVGSLFENVSCPKQCGLKKKIKAAPRRIAARRLYLTLVGSSKGGGGEKNKTTGQRVGMLASAVSC